MKLSNLRNIVFSALLASGIGAAKMPAPALTGDDAIVARAIHEVRMYPWYGVFDNVEVGATDGTLHISGEVTQPSKKADLGRIMAHIPGVVAVDNDLVVAPLSSFDDQIRRQVARSIFRDPVLSRYESQPYPAIHIIVNNGHVTLEGVVRTEQDKAIAGIRASQSLSFGKTINNLRVELPAKHS